MAEQKALQAVERAGVAPLGDPVEQLRALAAEALDLRSYFRARVDALEELRYQAGAGEQIRGELTLYLAALDRSQRFVADLAKLGLSERAIRVDEAKVLLVVAAVQRVLEAPELGLDSAKQSKAKVLIAEAFEDD
ncbi:MAG: hypothetical protein ACYCYB_03540 [Candidatus Dormibacteria bacterium]